jgi:hypothetical protein
MSAFRVWLLPVTVLCLAAAGPAAAQPAPGGQEPVTRMEIGRAHV